MIVRRVDARDWLQLKEIRLEALAEAQLAFAEWLADAQAQTDADWQARAARSETQYGSAQFVAEGPDGRWLGIAGCFYDASRPEAVWVYFVYVRPAHRGSGVLDALIAAIDAFAPTVPGVHQLLLQVHSANARAITAYERLGFVDRGVEIEHPLDPSQTEREMYRAVGAKA